MNKEYKLLIDSIAHYNRMIIRVEEYPENEYSSKYIMFDDIREDWFGGYCSLCKEYFNTRFKTCDKCLLKINNQHCFDEKSYWDKLNASFDWKEWLKYAKKLRDFMIKLLKKYK